MRFICLILIFLSVISDAAITSPDTLEAKAKTSSSCEGLCDNVVGIVNPQTNCNENYVFDKSLYYLKLDTLAQVRFWRNIMKLHEDSAIVNFASSRNIIQKISIKDWNSKTDSVKKWYRDSVRFANSLDTTHRVLITNGKKYFYDFDKTSLNFQKGIHCFVENNVDPWFAQAILLIESPNKLQRVETLAPTDHSS